MTTPVVVPIPYSETSKAKTEKKRTEEIKKLIEEIKMILVQKNLGMEGFMTSQEQVLFRVVYLLKGVDLSLEFRDRILRTPSDANMTKEEKISVKKRREQYRRTKIETAIRKLEEFIFDTGLGSPDGSRLTKNQILHIIRDHVLTLPTAPLPQATPLLAQIASQMFSYPTVTLPHGFLNLAPGQQRTGYSTPDSPESSSGPSHSSTGTVTPDSSSQVGPSGSMGFPIFPSFYGILNVLNSQTTLPALVDIPKQKKNGFMMSNLLGSAQNEENEDAGASGNGNF